ncbi:high mobility group box domain containing protein [Entamoeba histolytica HM-1:IMSS-B]|uniref:High mobility group (HMG) box domain containing protein n=6 Tax=Entamoeba histolytica TaxID=5759 RepID=C4M6W3_ENTH1|nr:high mobility group (HMG) box domain containing protein [Entamoeba histolytica HM-1:IMSS]EMD49773.1 high mobility group (HMG) box domain containing protein [Entamoeba histolytica KU27]EMH75844.1 high mobility group box domain containing protein [Entamoeba histolytica HM-1:IMSS-B]EMS14832.1 high mobility group (HMG) box domain containing protein [Entamoeba histolytica HM-3:IMSS]ENY60431.1 high mobility group (HMG) box domain containing protein [Entamoeba histolytica HM-1:IMSS-A]GAT97246.1 hi|eukprot:XP_651313.2 high mobility group (HMG) box domain containing protein [Entamoeba histolytica HM-1:IMSS]
MHSPKLPKPFEEKKRKKITVKEKNERREGELTDLARGIYMKWKGRELVRENPTLTMKIAEERALELWETEQEDVIQTYFKTAIIENVLLGEEGYSIKKKKNDGMKRKEEWHPYLLFCKEHREELKQEGVSGNEVMTMLSDKWKALSEDERSHYSELAKENKKRDLGDEEEKKELLPSQLVVHSTDIPPLINSK